MPHAGSATVSVGAGGQHLHHQADDVARSAELAVDPRRGQLGEQVFVQVAFGIVAAERQVVDHVDRRNQQALLLDQQLRVLHELAERRTLHRRLAEVGKHPIPHQGQHLIRAKVLEPRPAQILLVRTEQARERLAGQVRLAFVLLLRHVQQTGEHQEGDLLDHRQRIGDAAGPELFPQPVDTALQISGDHDGGILSGSGENALTMVSRSLR